MRKALSNSGDGTSKSLTPEELRAHEALIKKIRAEEPSRSCDMVRAWMKLNIESSMTRVWNN